MWKQYFLRLVILLLFQMNLRGLFFYGSPFVPLKRKGGNRYISKCTNFSIVYIKFYFVYTRPLLNKEVVYKKPWMIHDT